MPEFSLRIPVSLGLALTANSAFAHAHLEKATPPVGGTVSSPSEIRLEFSEGVEPKFSKVTLTGPGGAAVPRGGEDGAKQPGCADRADFPTPFRPRLQGALAGGVGRHAPHTGDVRVHCEMSRSPGVTHNSTRGAINPCRVTHLSPSR